MKLWFLRKHAVKGDGPNSGVVRQRKGGGARSADTLSALKGSPHSSFVTVTSSDTLQATIGIFKVGWRGWGGLG